jgi:signal transduction histidine kinase
MIDLRIASLIHNARNRLMPVIDRLRREGQPDAAAEIDHIGALLGLAMTLFRQGRKSIEVFPGEVDLDEFFKELASEIKKLAPLGASTELHSDLAGMPYPVWQMDYQLIQLVLLDALMNAWRHARHKVSIKMQLSDGYLCFEIRDDGDGFPAEWLAENCMVEKKSVGTGVGLTIARQVAAQHLIQGRHGRIELENCAGAVFRLLLP